MRISNDKLMIALANEGMLLKELAQAQLETEQKREKMKDAMLKVKALEKLKEARQRDWALENKRKEEKELDDIVNSKQFRT